MPTTPKPQAKVGFFAKIKNAFAPKKQVVKKKSYNNNKKRRNYNKRSNKK
jgi:hypothetical protein